MSRAPRAVTIVIQQDGATRSQTYRVPVWMLRAAVSFMAAAAVAAVVVAALYGPLLRAASRVPGLERQVARLESDNAKVRRLSATLGNDLGELLRPRAHRQGRISTSTHTAIPSPH